MSGKDEQQAFRELHELLESDSFSGVAFVIREGRPLVEFAGGLSNRQRGQAIRFDTRFATASVSKMFTAICLARLADAGVCRFEQPLIEIVPWLGAHFDRRISLAALLSHRSGLGDYLDDEAELPFVGMDVATLDCPRAFLPHVLQVSRGDAGGFSYSSAGFVLLGVAIEELTGMSFPDAMAHWVLDPAGLQSTGFPEMDAPAEDFALGYLPDGRPNTGHLPRVGGADGGIVTTVADLKRLFNRLRTEGFVSETARRFLWQNLGRISEISSYGHGFYLTRVGDEWWPGHTGSDPGVSARVAFSPKSESSIIILCNGNEMAFRVFRLALDCLQKWHPEGDDKLRPESL
ncbi:serine hydrolase domain-containing protein [Haloferula sargassicola]|uniref:Penicillin-binding protein 4 n=1 Tax=Haloferula sargassicola TaxID=490096 RepID=A0ABP9URW1_9BACT